MNELLGKYAVLTGAAGGIGWETALEFAREGAAGIAIADIDFLKAETACVEINRHTGCKCIPVKVDVSKPEDISHLFEMVQEEFNSVDILVNCAGICTTNSIEEIDVDKWNRVLSINLTGSYLCAREAFKHMKAKKYGKIVNVSSISGRIGGIATGIDYTTSKGALISMTMTLAKAGGPFNINVNAVAPGFIDTGMTKDFKHFDADTVPLKRIGTTQDVANTITFLVSDRSSYITGTTIDINGGVYMG